MNQPSFELFKLNATMNNHFVFGNWKIIITSVYIVICNESLYHITYSDSFCTLEEVFQFFLIRTYSYHIVQGKFIGGLKLSLSKKITSSKYLKRQLSTVNVIILWAYPSKSYRFCLLREQGQKLKLTFEVYFYTWDTIPIQLVSNIYLTLTQVQLLLFDSSHMNCSSQLC